MSNHQTSLSALNFRVKRPQHSWTQEERYLLCCLRRFFVLQYPQITRLFNEIYSTKIRAEGFSEGLKKSTVTTQWEDLGRRFHDDWKHAHHDVPFDQGPSHFNHIFQKIRTAAAALHIALVPRARDLDISRFGLMATTRRAQPAQPVQPAQRKMQTMPAASAQETTTDITEVHQLAIVAQENSCRPSQAATASKPRPHAEITDPIAHIRSYGLNRRAEFPRPNSSAEIPPLLWRFSNDDSAGINSKSGYIAYAFTENLGKIPRPEERLEEFPAWVWSHVNKKRIPSPFISTSMDPLVPLHRALRANKNSIFSLINPGQIEPNHIFLMKDLMKQYSIFTRGYYGTKEYIVWGSISRNAILMSLRVDELLEITNQHPDIKETLQLEVISESRTCKTHLFDRLAARTFDCDFQVGKTVGKLLKLLHLQKEYINDVATALNKSWKFANSEDTAQFLRGVNAGYNETAVPQTEPSSSPPSSNRLSGVGSMDDTDLTAKGDFVLVESSQRNCNDYEEPCNNRAIDESKVRESIDRLSILDSEEDNDMVIVSNTPCPSFKGKEIVRPTEKRPATTQFPVESKFRKTDGILFPSRNRPVAKRQISMFNPNSSSWSPIRDSDEPDTKVVVVKKEEVLPSIEEVEEMKTQTTPIKYRIKQSRSRSSSIESESTIRNDTPMSDRFGRER
ncbi:hypothetical protein PISL3812_07052 [Talaromyces islandicus]|uniref:DUF7587 domain-containing protein n=1 Tax=Talaromyces islandicus TaxID=28573 RepID=A0A0U1M4R4_TALIS|nr:hypothetical protein PISL3812_07052 [Talaromyces islandicus]